MFRYAKNVRLSLSGSLWLFVTPTLAPFGFNLLSQAFTGSHWLLLDLSLALYGSLWLPFWLSLALTATLWHTLALSGSLMLSNFAYTSLDRLTGPLLGSHRRCQDDELYPSLGVITLTLVSVKDLHERISINISFSHKNKEWQPAQVIIIEGIVSNSGRGYWSSFVSKKVSSRQCFSEDIVRTFFILKKGWTFKLP